MNTQDVFSFLLFEKLKDGLRQKLQIREVYLNYPSMAFWVFFAVSSSARVPSPRLLHRNLLFKGCSEATLPCLVLLVFKVPALRVPGRSAGREEALHSPVALF